VWIMRVSMRQCIFACVATYAYGSVLYIDVALYLLCDVYMLLVYTCMYICIMLLVYMYTVCMYVCGSVREFLCVVCVY
jgi:hypothetical protein